MSSIKSMEKANDRGFRRRVKYFMQKAATAILGEGAVANHAERAIYASSVLDGTASIYEMSVAVVTNGTIDTTIDDDGDPIDSDIEFTVNSLIDDFAGVGA